MKSSLVASSVVGLLCASCAAGPKPVPAGVTAAERLAFCEQVTLGARGTASFEIDSQGAHAAHFTGSLELTGSNALLLTAEGKLDKEDVRLELDSTRGDINRSVTRGASVNSHNRAAASSLNEAVVIGLIRMGLLHNLAMLSGDQEVSQLDGGIRALLKISDVRDVGPEQLDGEACHRIDYSLLVDATKGEGSLCIADLTGLPLQRRLTVHFEGGDMTESERFRWKLK